MIRDEIVKTSALVLQILVAGYALWLNRIFGTRRAGWALCLAFTLMLVMHINEMWDPAVTVSALGLPADVAYAFISLLLLLGLSHLGTVLRERQQAQDAIREARDQLEKRVQERTGELMMSNAQLREEVQQRKRAEDEIRASHELYRGLVDSLNGIIFECDKDLKFTFVSSQSERLLGYAADDWLQTITWRELVHPLDFESFVENSGRCAQNNTHDCQEFRVIAKNNQVRWLRQIASLVSCAGGEDRIRGVLLDVTERKELEDELRQMQKMEAIGRLAGGVAHDFNNLLTVIQGYSQLLLSDEQGIASSSEYARQIHQAAERAAELTQQLLAFSRKQEIKLTSLNINNAVESVIKMLRVVVGVGVSVRLELSAELPPILADAGQLGQVLVNLAANSRDAMPDGGNLVIETEVVTFDGSGSANDPEARLGTFVCLSVTDTGTGIAPEVLPQIFEPFFTTKEVGKGTGLGLSTVYGIVKQHQGWIKVSSQLNQGTTFRLYFAAADRPIEMAPEKIERVRRQGNHETILVVEDEPELRDLVVSILENVQYRVIAAPSGPAALKLWSDHGKDVDLLLTDVIMPEGLSGADLVRRIRADRPNLPAILTSGYAPDLTRDSDVAFIQKPYQPSTLIDVVQDCLTRSESIEGRFSVV